MSMRISDRLALPRLLPLVLAGALSGCFDDPDEQSKAEDSAPARGEPIACALEKGAPLKTQCLAELDEQGDGMIIHHPDGGFRRFILLPGGAGVASADGADEVVQGISGGKLDVRIADEHYLLPAVRP